MTICCYAFKISRGQWMQLTAQEQTEWTQKILKSGKSSCYVKCFINISDNEVFKTRNPRSNINAIEHSGRLQDLNDIFDLEGELNER